MRRGCGEDAVVFLDVYEYVRTRADPKDCPCHSSSSTNLVRM